jgi:hypothetical protein
MKKAQLGAWDELAVFMPITDRSSDITTRRKNDIPTV